MDMRPVSSSNISAVGYDPDTETLRVQFTNGSIYEYKNVPSVLFDEFLAAGSLGSFLNRNIRYSFPYEKIG